MTPQPLITISNVSKNYGDVTALDDVSLQINANEFFALLGPSGCGKTTLLRAIAGFEDPDTGRIDIHDADGVQDLIAYPPNKRPVNLMFQSYALFPHMNVTRNIAYGLEREGLSKSEINDRVDEVLETVSLTDKAKVRPAQLSGGQRQRVALARAIVKRPKLLLLDEPLSALDRKVRAEMQVELKRLQHEVGITFVVVTHDQEEAMSMADRIAVLDQGRVQQIDDPVTLYSEPTNVFVADFIGSNTMIPGTATPSGLRALDTDLPARNPTAVAGPAILMVRPEDAELTSTGGLLRGAILETHFYGGASTTMVRIDGLPTPFVISHSGAPKHSVGTQVGVRWNASDAIVLKDEER